MVEVLRNEEKKGIELYFDTKPAREILEKLKEQKFRWHNVKKCWYAKENENTLKIANDISEGKEIGTAKKEKLENALGIKVGDIFEMSWGYEQTNVNFFRVKELKGKTQVVIQEVVLAEKEVEDVSGMARYVKYDINDYGIVEKSYEIQDNEKGAIKKVLGTKENPYLHMTSYANANKYYGERVYESWYY